MLGSEATGHCRARVGTGSLLTSSVRVVSGSVVTAAAGRETQPHENGRSTFYIDPTAYETQISESKSESGDTVCNQSDDLEQEETSGEDSGIDGKSLCDDVDYKEEALPSVKGVANPAMALTRLVSQFLYWFAILRERSAYLHSQIRIPILIPIPIQFL